MSSSINKICSKCRHLKPIEEFKPKKGKTGERNIQCRSCIQMTRKHARNFSPSDIDERYYNEDQTTAITVAVSRLKDLIRAEKEGVVSISGPAGSGKTEIIRWFIRHLPGDSFTLLAPTHKACNVLRDRLHYEVQTCHRFLSGSMSYDDEGKQVWSFQTDSKVLASSHVIIIDEASMVNQSVYKEFIKLIKRLRCKILIVGDKAQLPPIHESCGLFYKNHRVDYDLKINVRNGDHKYNKMLSFIRTCILNDDCGGVSQHSLFGYLNGFVDTSPFIGRGTNSEKVSWRDSVLEKFFSGEEEGVILAFRTNERNNSVRKMNELVRVNRFGPDAPEWVSGDIISFDEFMTHTTDLGSKVFYRSCATFTVTQCIPMRKEYRGEMFQGFGLILNDGNMIFRVCKDDLSRFKECSKDAKKEILSNIKNKELKGDDVQVAWKSYYEEVASICAPISYGYAQSIYKSQGSGYSSVFVFLSDFSWTINKNPTLFFQLLYVSLSRSMTTSSCF